MSEKIEMILTILEKGGINSKESLSQKTGIPKPHVEKIIDFLRQFRLCESDQEMANIRLSPEFLNLPCK